MRASGINYLPPGEAEKRVCAALGSKWAFADRATFQLIPQDVDFAKIRALSTNLFPLFKGGIIRKGSTQLHNL